MTRYASTARETVNEHALTLFSFLLLFVSAIKFSKVGGVQLKLTGRRLAPMDPTPVSADSPVRRDSGSISVSSSALVRTRTLGGLRQSPRTGGRALDSASSNPASAERWQLTCSIIDSGIGISAEQMQLLFQTFSQVQHMSGEYGGTGLGLVISMRLVEAMGGDIAVDSELGRGSTFTFSIVAEVPTSRSTSGDLSSPNPSTNTLAVSSRSAVIHERSSAYGSSHNTPLHTPKQSPTSQRRILTLQRSPTQPPTKPTLFGLSSADQAKLRSARILFIGQQHAPSEAWINLLQHFGADVHVCGTTELAHTWMKEAVARKRMADPSGAMSALPTSASNLLHVVDTILVDLDSPGVTEDAVMDALDSHGAALLMLFLYSSKHMAALPTQHSAPAHAAIEAIAPSQTSNATPSPASSPMLGSAAPQPSGSATSTSAPATVVAGLASPPLMNLSQNTGIHTSSPGTRPMLLSALCSVKRNLKKPFRLGQLLHAVLHLMAEDASIIPSDAQRPTRVSRLLNADFREPEESLLENRPDSVSETLPLPSTSAGMSSRNPMQVETRGGNSASASGTGTPPSPSSSSAAVVAPSSALVDSVATPASSRSTAAPSSASTSLLASAVRPLPRGSPAGSSRTKLVSMSAEYPLRILLAEVSQDARARLLCGCVVVPLTPLTPRALCLLLLCCVSGQFDQSKDDGHAPAQIGLRNSRGSQRS